MSENSYDYLVKRCEMLENQVKWYRRNIIECVSHAEVSRDLINRTSKDYGLQCTKHSNIKCLLDTVEKSNVITYEEREDYMGIRFSHKILLFSGIIP